jgi:hypothetical protein
LILPILREKRCEKYTNASHFGKYDVARQAVNDLCDQGFRFFSEAGKKGEAVFFKEAAKDAPEVIK